MKNIPSLLIFLFLLYMGILHTYPSISRFCKELSFDASPLKNDYTYEANLRKLIMTIEFKLFRRSALPNEAILAKEGWWFLGNDYGQVINETLGQDTFSIEELNYIERKIRNLEKNLQTKGINFFIVIAPNKHSIQPNYFGTTLYNRRKIDQIQDLRIPFLISLEESLSNYQDKNVYYKTNSHWTSYGAYLGYRYFLKYINMHFNLDIDPLRINQIDFKDRDLSVQDIPRSLGLKLMERRFDISYDGISSDFDREFNSYYKNHRNNKYQLKVSNKGDKNTRRILFYRDSFGAEWISLLAKHCSHMDVIQDFRIDWDFVNHSEPDIIILEIVERNLDGLKTIY